MELKTVRLHGKTFQSNIAYFERLADDKDNEWREEDQHAVKQWHEAVRTIESLSKSELKYLNENLNTNQVLDDLQYYLADVGLWTGLPPYGHPTVEEDVARRKDFEKTQKTLDAEHRKRELEYKQQQQRAIEQNNYRNPVHPDYQHMKDAEQAAIHVITHKAFIEDFGTDDRVGGIQLYDNAPLWLQKAWQTIYDYYINSGIENPYPEADFATVMGQVVRGVNGSNDYLMKQNTQHTRNNPTHWTYENDFGKARVISEGRTLRYGGQCDEVILDKADRIRVIKARRQLIHDYRMGFIKDIKTWPSLDTLDVSKTHDYKESYERQPNGKTARVGHDLVDEDVIKEDENKELILTVTDYAKEHWQGDLHVERWKRVLEALDPSYDYTYPPMTAAEAQGYVKRGWKRWVPVMKALTKIESDEK